MEQGLAHPASSPVVQAVATKRPCLSPLKIICSDPGSSEPDSGARSSNQTQSCKASSLAAPISQRVAVRHEAYSEGTSSESSKLGSCPQHLFHPTTHPPPRHGATGASDTLLLVALLLELLPFEGRGQASLSSFRRHLDMRGMLDLDISHTLNISAVLMQPCAGLWPQSTMICTLATRALHVQSTRENPKHD